MMLPKEFFVTDTGSVKRKRGRPQKDSLKSYLNGGSTRLAKAVFDEEAKLDGKYGAFMIAVRIVAKRERMKSETLEKAEQRVRKTAQRYKLINRQTAFLNHRLKGIFSEIDRRTRYFPDSIKAVLQERMTTNNYLKFLIENNIDGNCPQWLIAEIGN